MTEPARSVLTSRHNANLCYSPISSVAYTEQFERFRFSKSACDHQSHQNQYLYVQYHIFLSAANASVSFFVKIDILLVLSDFLSRILRRKDQIQSYSSPRQLLLFVVGFALISCPPPFHKAVAAICLLQSRSQDGRLLSWKSSQSSNIRCDSGISKAGEIVKLKCLNTSFSPAFSYNKTRQNRRV